MSQPGLSGKTAVVTGSAKGIGRGIAVALAAHGARVVVNYRRNAALADETASEIRAKGGEAVSLQADVTSEEGAKLLAEAAVREWGRFDILVNNVGDFLVKETSETSPGEWRKIVESNLFSAVNCARYAQAEMRKRNWGRIINIGFAGSENVKAFPRIAAYASSKTGVIIFTKSLAKELAPFGITVNSVSPGIMESSVLGAELQEKMTRKVPAGRAGTPGDVARAVLWLVSDEASYVTGANIVVSGGWGI